MDLLAVIIIVGIMLFWDSSSNEYKRNSARNDGDEFYINNSGKIIDVKTNKYYKPKYKKELDKESRRLGIFK